MGPSQPSRDRGLSERHDVRARLYRRQSPPHQDVVHPDRRDCSESPERLNGYCLEVSRQDAMLVIQTVQTAHTEACGKSQVIAWDQLVPRTVLCFVSHCKQLHWFCQEVRRNIREAGPPLSQASSQAHAPSRISTHSPGRRALLGWGPGRSHSESVI